MIWIALLLIAFLTDQVSDKECGLRCLFIALVSCGSDEVSLGELQQGLGPVAENGYSLTQLEAAARAKGFHTRLAKTNLEQLGKRPRPFACIAHVTPNHYYCVVDILESEVVIMSDEARYSVAIGDFKKIWTGNVLLISSEPIVSDEWLTFRSSLGYSVVFGSVTFLAFTLFFFARKFWRARVLTWLLFVSAATLSQAGCDYRGKPHSEQHDASSPQLDVSESKIDLGEILPSHDWFPYSIKVTNNGNAPLSLNRVEVSCVCLRVESIRTEFQPGESAELKLLALPMAGEGNGRTAKLTLHSSDPANPHQEVVIKWKLKQSISFDQTSIDIGPIEPNSTVPFSLRIISGSKELVKTLSKELRFLGDGITVTLDTQAENNLVSGTVTAGVEEGDYAGRISQLRQNGEYSPALAFINVRIQRTIGVAPSQIALVTPSKTAPSTQEIQVRIRSTSGDISQRIKSLRITENNGVEVKIKKIDMLSSDLAVAHLTILQESFNGSIAEGAFEMQGGEDALVWNQRIIVHATSLE